MSDQGVKDEGQRGLDTDDMGGGRRVQGKREWNEGTWGRKERKAGCGIKRSRGGRVQSRQVEQRRQSWERERKWKAGLS